MKDPAPTEQPWEQIAQSFAASRPTSVDRLIEWPAQLRLTGELAGKRILDIGCGTGDKARYFAERGAAHVLAIDPSQSFATQWAGHESCANLELVRGGFDDLLALPQLQNQRFDIVACFQALMYTSDLRAAVKTFASLLVPCGTLTVSVPHPFRFAILRNEIEGWGWSARPFMYQL